MNILYLSLKFSRKILQKLNKICWDFNCENIRNKGNNVYMEKPYTIIGVNCISIGNNFHCGPGCRIQAIEHFKNQTFQPQIYFGNNISINKYVEISCINKLTLSDGVQIASNVLITDHYHGKIETLDLYFLPSERELYSKGEVFIGKNVWIGFGVAVLPGVTIGDNCIIGANSVITKNIPSNSVAAGNPCIVIRKL